MNNTTSDEEQEEVGKVSGRSVGDNVAFICGTEALKAMWHCSAEVVEKEHAQYDIDVWKCSKEN